VKTLWIVVYWLLFLFSISAQTLLAQFSPGIFADANHPAGPPDPQRLDQIWQVDPITGSLTVTIPFTSTPVGGRGPKIPFALKYNSSATLTLQTNGNLTYSGNGGEYPTASCETSPGNANGCAFDASAPMPPGSPQILQTFQWATPGLNGSMGPAGPWTTTGPILNSSTTNIGNQVLPGGNGVQQINYGDGCEYFGPFIYIDENGGAHDLNIQQMQSPADNNFVAPCSTAYNNSTAAPNGLGYGQKSITTDGSAYITTPTGGVYPDGTAFLPSGDGIQLDDTNGNYSIFQTGQNGITTITDALARTVISTNLPIETNSRWPVGQYTITTDGETGTSDPETYTITVAQQALGAIDMLHPTTSEVTTTGYCIASVTCPTNYAVQQLIDQAPINTFNAITNIGLPNGTSYGFTYDSTYGTLSTITFPSGGSVTFTYNIRSDGGGYNSFSRISTMVVSTATIADDRGARSEWQYNFPSYVVGSGQLTSTITAPDGTYTNYVGAAFSNGLIAAVKAAQAPMWKETYRQTFGSGGSALRAIATTYTTNGAFPTQIATTLQDGPIYEQQLVNYAYDTYYNVIEKDESDYFGCSSSCTPPSLPPNGWLRKTFTYYNYQNNPSWVTANIVNKPEYLLVTNGTGRPYSLVWYQYDQSAVTALSGTYTGLNLNYSGPRGNLTNENHCSALSATAAFSLSNLASAGSACVGSWLATINAYDQAGQRLSTKDPNGHFTYFSYTDVYTGCTPPNPTDGYVTTVTYADSLTDTFTYWYCIGEVATHTDSNLQKTSYDFSDSLNRLKTTTSPDTGVVTNTYTDPPPTSVTVNATTGEPQAPNVIRQTNYDGLGRKISTQLLTDPNSAVEVDSSYDQNGRLYSVTNPYYQTAANDTAGTTYYTYDGLNRPLTITNPPNTPGGPATSRSFSYEDNLVFAIDENSNIWAKAFNGLGQMSFLIEPNGSSKTYSMQTNYSYDPLSNLLSVAQLGGGNASGITRSRSFSYDAESRLLTAMNPETGTVTYAYDNDGNVQTRSDARGVVTTYVYDTRNRLLSKTYTNDSSKTPSSCFQYSTASLGLGYLGNAWSQAASAGNCPSSPPSSYVAWRSVLAYDKMGRVWNEKQYTPSFSTTAASTPPCTTAGNPGTSGILYCYNYLGQITFSSSGAVDPLSGNAITLASLHDGASIISSVTSNVSGPAYPASLFTAVTSSTPTCASTATQTHAPFGGLMNWKLGTNIAFNRDYDPRLRVSCEQDAGSAVSTQTTGSTAVVITGTEQSN